MKQLLSILCLVFLISCSNEVPEDKLVERQGITYEVNSTTPFTGIEISDYSSSGEGVYRQEYKNGLKGDLWEKYYPNGNLEWRYKGDDFYEQYYVNGQLKNRDDGDNFVYYYSDGQLEIKREEDSFESFHSNGQLKLRGNYKDGKRDGFYEEFDRNGNLIKTEEYKDGELIE